MTQAAATGLKAHVTRKVSVSADAAWAAVGDFCAIATWHPAVAMCELSTNGGTTYRKLTLQNGATLLEKLVARDDAARSYSYTIEAGPLPISGYASTIKVAADGSGAILDWVGTFAANGVPDTEAVTIIAGIYEAGLDSLAARLSK